MTKVEIIAASEVDAGLETAWRRLCDADPDLRSAFYAPAFCRAVAEVRDDVRVAVISQGGETVGFLPHHRRALGRLAPLGGQISDYQGVIGGLGGLRGMPGLLGAMGAQVYDFNHVPVSQAAFRSHAYLEAASPFVDLSAGFEPWRLERRAKARNLREVERRGRKLGREVGALRFVANDTSDEVWQPMLDWKRETLRRMGVEFILDRPWARGVIERIRETDSKDFGGLTSVLWAGDTLAAVHFVLRTGTTQHGWFASYNPELERYSPGLVLLVESLRHAAEVGITEFDFGRGDERYKREFGNGARMLCEGSVERALSPLGVTRRLRKAAQAVAERSGSSRLASFTRRAGNRLLSAGRIA